jgi:FkbM family methyltransferase
MEQMAAALEREFPDLRKKRPDEYHMLTTGFNRVTRTRQGLVLYNRHDRIVGRSLDRYGEYSAAEADLYRQAVRPGWTAVEAGANVGMHTLTLSRLVGSHGEVHAFEPNRLAFQALCANLALNSIVNVNARQAALGDKSGTLSLAPPGASPSDAAESAPIMTLDTLELSRCEFFKVKGPEQGAITGARQTIERFRPILYVENDRSERSPALIELLLSLGYRLYWHLPALFDERNFYQNPHNEFGNAVSVYMLGVHSSVPTSLSGLREITSPTSDWRPPTKPKT